MTESPSSDRWGAETRIPVRESRFAMDFWGRIASLLQQTARDDFFRDLAVNASGFIGSLYRSHGCERGEHHLGPGASS